ncbi:MAG: DALR anticodon-binding domain-containing protein [Pseudanabaena sp.]
MKFNSPSQAIQMGIADAIKTIFQTTITPREIAISACYPKYAAHYTSVIALAISQRLSAEAINIAEAIAQTCAQNPEISSQWQLRAFGKGWLNIVLSDQYICTNLLALESWQLEGMNYNQGFWQRSRLSNLTMRSPDPVLQYAYARCCALMRLAYHENLLMPSVLINDSSIANKVFTESAEINLYLQNVAIADFLLERERTSISDHHLSNPKLSQALAKSFLDFYDHCRIFGVNHDIAVRRLLLIRTTQKLLLAIAPIDINYTMYL